MKPDTFNDNNEKNTNVVKVALGFPSRISYNVIHNLNETLSA